MDKYILFVFFSDGLTQAICVEEGMGLTLTEMVEGLMPLEGERTITVGKLRGYYETISNGKLPGDPRTTQSRANIVRLLEIVSHSDIKNTQDFHRKVGNFFLKHIDMATTLRVHDTFIGTDPLVAKNMAIWADKRKAQTQKLIPLKHQG